MIITRIFQGLGNQMFQYAYGLARAIELGTALKIDTSYFQNFSEVEQWGYKYKRDFGLNRFNISAQEASKFEIENLLHPRGKNLWRKLKNRYRLMAAPYQYKFYVKEKSYEFDPRLLKLMDNTYVEGYFTDERYFRDYRKQLAQEFMLSKAPTLVNADIIQKMKDSNSVCISIRRTNFLNNPLHGTCGENYYYKAMDEMAAMVSSPEFYVFSDDNDWVNKHFKSKYTCHLMQHNYPDFYEDFRLMTNCKHHIIPNSTFPWWAAWLADDPFKVVVAPKYWLNSSDIDYSGFVPPAWIKLEHKINTIFTGD